MTNLFLQSGSGQSGLPMLIMMVAIFAIMWLFMIRPQQKKMVPEGMTTLLTTEAA